MKTETTGRTFAYRGCPKQNGHPIYFQLLGASTPYTIEIDRAWCTLSYVPQNADRPRDVICKLHRYSTKEAIMKAACDRPKIKFDGALISLFSDLKYCTLMQRWTVQPLLEAMRAIDVKYHCGFPFCIIAARGGGRGLPAPKMDA